MCDCLIIKRLKKIEKKLVIIMSKITDFATAANTAFTTISASLDNIVSDEANLAKQITDLKNQLASSGSNLTAEDQAALDAVVVSATTLATKTATIAEAVPDLPAPPPGV
jgi:hypothetical protein